MGRKQGIAISILTLCSSISLLTVEKFANFSRLQ